MNSPTTHKTGHGECCSEQKCESGLRNNYFEGKRLTADSFRVEQKYLLERRRLLNRAIHGWGVVYGYAIGRGAPTKPTGPNRLSIGAGLALDACGRELLHTDSLLELSELVVLDENGVPVNREKAASLIAEYERRNEEKYPQCWLLKVHYAEQQVGLVKVKDPCECECDEWDHTCETVRFSLQRIPCDECCVDFGCELSCNCGTGPCCGESMDDHDHTHEDHEAYDQEPRQTHQQDSRTHEPHDRGQYPNDPDRPTPHGEPKPVNRGGCQCICDHSKKLPTVDCPPLYEVEEPCGESVWVDVRNGVPLACVDLVKDDCDRWMFRHVEDCGPRRIVKRNDVMFDLIRGCDLTQIIEIGWAQWHRQLDAVPFEDFSKALGPDGDRENEYVTDAFWIRFSRPVREYTLRPDCFAMTVMSSEREGGWLQTFRVPIVRIDTSGFEADDPPGHVFGARIVVDGSWVEDGVRGRRSLFIDGETWIEFEIRGDFIVDCNGQTVDANPRGLAPAPSGNGAPGDAFLSTFRVAAAREAPARAY